MDTAEAGPSTARPANGDYPYLAALNPAQLKAVTADPSVALQILAGPGSGKTRVLTSRVAYLVQHHGFKPHQITAVTFTNKAANEMRKRLQALLGEKHAGQLVLGTFHATCAKYLRRFGGVIDLANNFAIADADDCKKIMSGLLKAKAEYLEGARMSLKESVVLSEISKAKAKEESPDGMAIRAASDPSSSTSTLSVIAELYAEYEEALRESNSLDFDDLLVFGLRLFRSAPRVLESCFHILVDEFQDTNTTQYELMKCFAKAHGGVTVVGDPDQSIYGWRSAEVENLNRMATDFPGVQAIYLEENYRSTGSILSAAHSIVTQDRDRIPKNLYTSHPKSTPATLKLFSTPVIEASFIATEIKRLIAYSGGVLNHGDFAILLRYNALSRVIESALQKDSIPNRIVGGHKFFERMEIKDLLAYLQLAENPGFAPAFIRVVNVPKRAIGDKSVSDLLAAAKSAKVSPMELCERIIDGDRLPAGIKAAIKSKLATFVGVVRKLRRAAQRGSSVADLLRLIIEKTGYEEYLRTSQQDFDQRWENVQELISFSVAVAEEQVRQANGNVDENGLDGFVPTSTAMEAIAMQDEKSQVALHPMFRRTSSDAGPSKDRRPGARLGRNKSTESKRSLAAQDAIIEILSSDDEMDEEQVGTTVPKRPVSMKRGDSDFTPLDEDDGLALPLSQVDDNGNMTPLSFFLQSSMLSTDTDADNNDAASVPKVTISTVHAAKGLEWPVVFIPAAEGGTYPSYRSTEPHEIAEERRLLYVAMTRAQTFLTISHCQYRMMGGEDNDKNLSEFVALSLKRDPAIFSSDLANMDEGVRKNIAGMLGRDAPDETITKDMIMRHVRAAPALSMWDAPEPRDRNFNRFARREVTKAARAAEYWADDVDEYALPGMPGVDPNRAPGSGFVSARDRMKQPGSAEPRSPKPPPVILKSRNHQFPEPLPFTFNAPAEAKRPGADLGMFTSSSSSSLAMMKGLGLPGSTGSNGSSPLASPNPDRSPKPPEIASFQSAANSSLSALKGLGLPDLPTGGLPTGGTGQGQGVQLAKGTKRLGMGRPAPWGTKRQRAE